MEIIKVLEELIRDNFDNEEIVITENTCLADLEDWDSMEQVNIITMLEEHYKFKFNVGEMTAMSNAKSAGEMVDIVAKKLN